MDFREFIQQFCLENLANKEVEMNDIVITGMGIVGPCGTSVEMFWSNLLHGNTNKLKDGSKSLYAGIVGKKIPEKLFPKRLINKCDDFSKMALWSSYEAISVAEIEEIDSNRVGIFIGNNTGGWNSSFSGLRKLHKLKSPVSPYMASNWFPAAVQGHMSIAYGFKGISKTFIADKVSALYALKFAVQAIESGQIDIAVVGGVEAPVNEWALKFYANTGEISKDDNYYFFDRMGRQGYLISEGAGFLILEKKSHALQRNAPKILGTLKKIIVGNCPSDIFSSKYETYKRLIETLIAEECGKKLFIPACSGNYLNDEIENKIINRYFYNDIVSLAKTKFGNTIAASSIIDCILSITAMNKSIIPVAANGSDFNQDSKMAELHEKISTSIVMSIGYGGSFGGVVLSYDI